MLKAFVITGAGVVSRDGSPDALAAAMRDPKAVFWVDILKPTDEELGLLDEVFGFHPLAIEDTINYMQRPKIESYDHIGTGCTEGYFYMVFHGPDLATFRENLRTKELDMFVSARYLVTVHDEEMKTINDILQRAEIDPRRVLDPGIDMLLHNVLDHLTDNYTPILDYLQEALDDLEDRALNDPTQNLLQEISMKKRELLNLRRIVGPQREVLAQLTRGEVPFIRPATRTYLRDVQDHLIRTVEMVELYRDLALGARDIYLSSVSNNLNRIMKALTVITVTALPFTIITSFYGMNFDKDAVGGFWAWMISTPAGFWLSMGSIVVMVGVLLFFFRKYKWI